MKRQLWAGGAVLAMIAATGIAGLAGTASAATGGDQLVTSGSPTGLFPQNKQNEPGLAMDPTNPQILVAGSNDEIDLGKCAANKCPFTAGVGVSGVYFSVDGGGTWTQPTYTGYSDRTGTPDSRGPIGTLPNYYEAGLVSGGDPELAFGPQPDGHGGFTYAGGASRLYYANLASNFPGTSTAKGFEAVTVSHTDDLTAAAAGSNTAWSAPVVESKQNGALFSDKESIAADNAKSSPYFGNVYVCNVGFRGQEIGNAVPEPVIIGRSTDGGASFTTKQATAATDNNQTGGRQGCALRTESNGTVVLVFSGYSKRLNSGVFYQELSRDGGQNFSQPVVVAQTAGIGQFDPVQGRFTIDGVAGSRTDVFPSLDVANDAPSGIDPISGSPATNEIVLSWADDRAGTNKEQAYLEYSTDGGRTYSNPVAVSDLSAGRANQPAVAIAPNGSEVYLTYNAYQSDWQSNTTSARLMNGVTRKAPVASDGTPGTFVTVDTGAAGDARGSSANALSAEFLGDYNYVVASNSSGISVFNDVRRATDCPAIDAYRQSLVDGSAITKPAPGSDCLATFGNSDIYSYVATP